MLVLILARSITFFSIIIKNTKVNGSIASKDLCKNFTDLISWNDLDVIIIARGGGSFEDLLCFNDEKFISWINDILSSKKINH